MKGEERDRQWEEREESEKQGSGRREKRCRDRVREEMQSERRE